LAFTLSKLLVMSSNDLGLVMITLLASGESI